MGHEATSQLCDVIACLCDGSLPSSCTSMPLSGNHASQKTVDKAVAGALAVATLVLYANVRHARSSPLLLKQFQR
jgi:hypothetical protein